MRNGRTASRPAYLRWAKSLRKPDVYSMNGWASTRTMGRFNLKNKGYGSQNKPIYAVLTSDPGHGLSRRRLLEPEALPLRVLKSPPFGFPRGLRHPCLGASKRQNLRRPSRQKSKAKADFTAKPWSMRLRLAAGQDA